MYIDSAMTNNKDRCNKQMKEVKNFKNTWKEYKEKSTIANKINQTE